MDEALNIIGRSSNLFEKDISHCNDRLKELIAPSSFLVIGGAGSIGQAVTREIFRRKPSLLHVVDISENNMVELVRDIRSTMGYIEGEFRTFSIDSNSHEFEALMNTTTGYDYVLNLSALKHVRSEKDPFTLMRLIQVNILNTIATIQQARQIGAKKYFCVSTDKAANPVNMMGASKRIMEMFLIRESKSLPISTARFANVAFSDGSLLHGFNQRFSKRQPITAPKDVRRYFVTPQESGELCLLSCLLGGNRDIFFPKLTNDLDLMGFPGMVTRFLDRMGFEPYECNTEDEARQCAADLIAKKQWPVYFFDSDTTGEKGFEEFHTENEVVDMKRFNAIGVIKNNYEIDESKLDYFLGEIEKIRSKPTWGKPEIVALFNGMLPVFDHQETGKYLDSRM